MSNKVIVAVLVLVVVIGVVFFYKGDGGNMADVVLDNSSDAQEQGDVVVAGITYTNDGFSPSVLTVSAGTTVVFMNTSQRDAWPASAVHPTHDVYDGTSMNEHCASGAPAAFDSCGAVAPGGEWSFVFSKIGEWKYHDHLNANNFGTIIVE